MTPKEKALKLSKSIGFSTLWRVSEPLALESLFQEFRKSMNLKRIYLVHKLAFEIMIGNLLNAYEKKQVVHIFLSASMSYEMSDLKIKIPAKHFSRIIKFLVKKGVISFYRGYKGKNKSTSSKIIINDDFMAWIPETIEEVKAKAPLMILKNKDKQIVRFHDESTKLKWLARYNRLLFKTYVSIGPNVLPPQQLYRVYNVNYRNGGRFYGGDFQTLPKKERKKILIDGVDCVELDYQCLHIHLLYLKEKAKLEGDAYLLPSYGPGMRNFVKFALMIVLNAPSFSAARKAIAFKAVKQKVKIDVNHLMNELTSRHRLIAHYFYKAEVAGELQNIESNIAAQIIRYFTSKGIVVLPIHDGFIIQSKYLTKLRTQMRKSFQLYTHSDFKIPVLRA